MFEQTHCHQRIPGPDIFGKGVCFAGQSIQPVSQHAIQPLFMHRIWRCHWLTQHRAHLDAYHPASMASLDRLCQPHPGRRNQRGTSAPPGSLRVTIGAANLPPVRLSSIADPGHASLLVGALARLAHHFGNSFIPRGRKGPGYHKAGGPILTQTSPVRAHPTRRARPVSSLRALF